jgi:flagellar biosynthesis/type III secretory pathway chaperone
MTPITTAAEAEQAIDDLATLIEKLTGVIAQETVLIHAGRIRNASALEPAKAELAGRLFVSSQRLKAAATLLKQTAPAHRTALAQLQEKFRAILQKNMIVLATAHAVSEGIMRKLSGQLARKASPQIYGATGRATAPNPKHGRPLAVSRTR